MKKILFLSLTLIFLLGLAAVASAGGYNPYESGDKYITKPHGEGPGAFYNNSTNFCKTCHAVHLAGLVTPSGGYEPGYPLGNSWRLLRATSAEDSCNYCHEGAGAHTNKIQYTLKHRNEITPAEYTFDPVTNQLAFGEHTIGASVIPDSDLNNPGGTQGYFPSGVGLSCNMCHSVHGAKTTLSSTKILRYDPAGNGGNIDLDGLPAPGGGKDTTPEAVRSAFCSDCHNLNPNWTDVSDERVNEHSHPLNTDAQMLVNGIPVEVSDPLKKVTECKSCHQASLSVPGPSNFPHQSVSHKLLRDDYRPPAYSLDSSQDIKNTQRQLPSMDTICLDCHGNRVGVTF